MFIRLILGDDAEDAEGFIRLILGDGVVRTLDKVY